MLASWNGWNTSIAICETRVRSGAAAGLHGRQTRHDACCRRSGWRQPAACALLPLAWRRFDCPNHRLKAWNEGVQRQLLQRPAEYLPGFQDAIRDYIRGLDVTRALVENTEVHVGISGEFGELEVSPRELSSQHLGRLVKVYGIVTKCSLVRPKLVKSVHYCPDTKITQSREYRDVTALVGLPTGAPHAGTVPAQSLQAPGQQRCLYVPDSCSAGEKQWLQQGTPRVGLQLE